MTNQTEPRIRTATVPDTAVLVVRGDVVTAAVTAHDAEQFARRFRDSDFVGVSGFYAANDDEVDALCEARLSNFATVAVFSRADLAAARIDVVPTFRTPHVTLACATVADVVFRLTHCPHRQLDNPYYGTEISEEGR